MILVIFPTLVEPFFVPLPEVVVSFLMNNSKTCVVAGHICLDIIPPLVGEGDFEATFRPGRLLETGPALMSTGGPVSNTGLALYNL